MKKWILGFLLFAIIAGETSCVVRDKDGHRHRRHRAVVVY